MNWKQAILIAILIALGGFFAYRSVMSESMLSSSGIAMAIVSVALVWAGLADIFFAFSLVLKIGNRLSTFLYLPLEYLKSPVEQFGTIRGLIENQEYDKAIASLNEILARKPFDPTATLLFAEILFEHKNEPEHGAALVQAYFAAPKLKAQSENIELLLRFCDYAAAQNKHATALKMLEQELIRPGYSTPEQKVLRLRLEAVQAKTNITGAK